ncbi:MAG: hypothetical protein RL701_5875, partial [Pseudomonadota bacterium]
VTVMDRNAGFDRHPTIVELKRFAMVWVSLAPAAWPWHFMLSGQALQRGETMARERTEYLELRLGGGVYIAL